MLQSFISGFLSVFRFGAVSVPQTDQLQDSAEYFCRVEKDTLSAYEKLVKEYERK